MSNLPTRSPTTIAFTDSVKQIQRARGSRTAYERVDARGFAAEITGDLAELLASIDTAFIATTNGDGQPYVQHRGGPKGFLRVLDRHAIGFAELAGNRQYITTGNLVENPRVCLIAIDFALRRRVKIWGTARVVPASDPVLAERLAIGGTPKLEHFVVIDVAAWDINCPQHIAVKIDAADVARLVVPLRDRIAELEAEVARLSTQAKP
jgi:predicted pyridoxine 5'-phosphate oxidase superfamily flavin-nucleotide-binding protein